jgi:putative RecB family exonuclease
MSFELPRSLSPSKVTSFRDCALAFRFSAIDHLPEPSSPAMVKGTLVHSALERLFWLHDQGDRSESVGLTELDAAWDELQSDPEYVSLGLTTDQAAAFLDDGATLVRNYFRLEDPNQVRTVGTELTLDAKLGSVRLRGIIDRLDLTDEGELVVVDYKTGRAPSEAYEQSKLVGVHIYAMLCEELLGRRPVRVELLHLREPTVITAKPSDQAVRGHRQRTVAVWSAIERACRDEDFRPKTSPLCKHCHFQAFCPAFGGDPALAAPTLLAPPIAHKGAA